MKTKDILEYGLCLSHLGPSLNDKLQHLSQAAPYEVFFLTSHYEGRWRGGRREEEREGKRVREWGSWRGHSQHNGVMVLAIKFVFDLKC